VLRGNGGTPCHRRLGGALAQAIGFGIQHMEAHIGGAQDFLKQIAQRTVACNDPPVRGRFVTKPGLAQPASTRTHVAFREYEHSYIPP
jgi:hypothetical protein